MNEINKFKILNNDTQFLLDYDTKKRIFTETMNSLQKKNNDEKYQNDNNNDDIIIKFKKLTI